MTRFASIALCAALLAGPTAPVAHAAATAPAPVAWVEIPSKDPARARKFYQGVFGWTFTAFPEYGYDAWRFRTGTPGLEGVVTSQIYTAKAKGAVLYMRVSDMETALTRAIALGGSIERPRTTISGLGSIVVMRDPDQNAIGLIGPRPRQRQR